MTSAILLAAGESVRMGQSKALLPWLGSTLLEFQLDSLLASGVEEVVVVLGHEAERLRPLIEAKPSVRTALNTNYRSGRSSSVIAGVSALSSATDAVLILGVDQPREPILLKKLIQAHKQDKALITIPTYRRKRGHPPIFSKKLFQEILSISEKKAGLEEVVHRHVQDVHEMEVEHPSVLLDLNSPAEYEKALLFLTDNEASDYLRGE